MNHKKWLLKQIALWRAEDLIDEDTAHTLESRYSAGSGHNTLTILFSVLGSLLIGAGIILILAKNWYYMPMGIKIVLSLLPLLAGQGLALFTVAKKYDSVAIREGVAVFYTAGVFAAMAMISQTFHLPSDFALYVLVSGLLTLPIIYILDAVSPLAVYYYAIINWGALVFMPEQPTPVAMLFFVVLFALGVLYVVARRKRLPDARHVYTVWISVIAGFAVMYIVALYLEQGYIDMFLACLVFFALLFAADTQRDDTVLPFKPLSVLGGLVLMLIISYGELFNSYRYEYYYQYEQITMGPVLLLLCAVAAAVSVALGIRNHRRDIGKLLFLAAMLMLGVMLVMSQYTNGEFVYTVLANLITGAVGVGILVRGAKSADLPLTNLGMLTTTVLIIMRFFDENFDFLWRGTAFLILGGVLLFINYKMMKKRKHAATVKEGGEA